MCFQMTSSTQVKTLAPTQVPLSTIQLHSFPHVHQQMPQNPGHCFACCALLQSTDCMLCVSQCPAEMQQDAACFRYSFTFFSGVAAGHVKLAPGHIDWAPAVIPDDISKDVPSSDTPVVAYASLNDHVSKFSFALFDFLYPVFNMLKLLGVYDPNFQLLLAEQHQVSLKARQGHFTPQLATLFTTVRKAFHRSGKLCIGNHEVQHANDGIQETVVDCLFCLAYSA